MESYAFWYYELLTNQLKTDWLACKTDKVQLKVWLQDNIIGVVV